MSLIYNDIYKIHILNNNETEKILIFIGNEENMKNIDLASIFTKKELDLIYSNNVHLDYVYDFIYNDNTIDSIKKKLVDFHSDLLFEEIYLFYKSSYLFNNIAVLEELSENSKKSVTQENLEVFLNNLNLPNNIFKDEPVEKLIEFQNIIELNLNDKEFSRSYPLDLKYSSVLYDYNFTVNPYLLKKQDLTLMSNTTNLVSTLNSNILLNNKPILNNNIYLVRTRDIVEYARKIDISEEYIFNVYYPYLKKENITSITELNKKYETLKKGNDKLLKNFEKIKENNKLYYNLSLENNNLNYTSTGITSFHLIVYPIYQINIHLDDLFKVLHASEEIPLIKLNPGSKQEKFIRLYSEEKTIRNEPIPSLPSGTILKNIKNLAKTKKIAFYIDFAFTNELKKISNPFYIDLYQNGQIEVKFNSNEPIKEEQMLFIINKYVNSIINDYNNFNSSTGFHLKPVSQLNDSNIDYLNIEYSIFLETEINQPIKSIINCSSNIFSFSNIKSLKDIELRFKKVAYYSEMDSITTFIIEKLKQNLSDKEVIELLILDFNISEEEAQNKLITFLNEVNLQRNLFNNKKIKIRNNPGFPISIKFNNIKNVFEILISNIDNFNYLKTIPIYINSFFKLLKGDTNRYVSSNDVKKICNKKEKTDIVVKEEIISNIEKPYSENKVPVDILAQMNEDTEDDDDDDEDLLNLLPSYNDEGEEELVEEGSHIIVQQGGSKEIEKNITNMSLSNPNPFFQRMEQLDPKLFLTKKIGNYNAYSRLCPSNVRRQPVILTNQEMEDIKKVSPDAFKHAIHYGSDPNNKFWYICPRYWCMLNNQPLSEKDVKEGKCGGKIIPFGAKKVPEGHYIYEFSSSKEHIGPDGEYIQHYPGFMKEDSHPDGLCVPCCFKSWDTNEQINRRKKCLENIDIKQDKKDEDYIINPEKFPIPEKRWGFLPVAVANFLNFETEKCFISKINHNIKKDTTCLLRRGSNNNPNLSFLSAINSLVSPIQNVEPVENLRKKIVSLVSLSVFIQLQHGTLVEIFSNLEMNKNNTYYNNIIKSYNNNIVIPPDNTQKIILARNINALLNFHKFILDDTIVVDYTYLWDIITTPGLLYSKGTNLIILDLPEDDGTNKVDLICPTNHYANSLYDINKESIILIKKQNNYEPIISYKLTKKDELIINKTFSINQNNELKELKPILSQLNILFKECKPLNSIPAIYKVKENLNLQEILKVLINNNFKVISQQVNYNNLIYGINIQNRQENSFYIPIKPSLPVVDIPLEFIEETRYNDYYSTYEFLKDINTNFPKIAVKPILKVVEDDLVVGFITNGNQFVEISPFIENENNIINLPVLNSANPNLLNKELMLNNSVDEQRVNYVNALKLENNMYIDFRNWIRYLLNIYEYINERKQIELIIESQQVLYEKIKSIGKIIKEMTKGKIVFEEMSKSQISDFQENSESFLSNTNKIYNKINIINGLNNNEVYFNKLADELIRYKRIRNYLLNPMEVLPLNRDYSVNNNELLIMMSLISKEYLDSLIPYEKNKYVINNSYYTAKPNKHFDYGNNFNQFDISKSADSDLKDDLIKLIDNINKIPGKLYSDLPTEYKLITFNKVIESNYLLLIFLIYLETKKLLSIEQLKKELVNEYNKYNKQNLLKFWILDGKKNLVKQILDDGKDIETIVNDQYYYLSIIDYWVLSRKFDLSLLGYSATSFPQTEQAFLKLNENNKDYVYLLKFAGIKANEPSSISIISKNQNLGNVKISKIEGLNRLIPELNKTILITDLNDFINKYKLKKIIYKVEE